MKHAGSCLCAEVRFEIEGDFEGFFLCHCGRCRKDSGSVHGANLFSSTAALKWLSGEEHISHFNLKPTRHSRSFCKTCGSVLPYTMGPTQYLIAPACSLDSDVPLQPDAHIFTADRANWDCDLHLIASFEQFPT